MLLVNKVQSMLEDTLTIEENKEKPLDFKLTLGEEQYLTGPIFNKSKKKNIGVFYDRNSNPYIKIGSYAGIVQLEKKRIHLSNKVNARLFYMLTFLRSEDEFLYDDNKLIEIKEGANFFDVIGRLFLNLLEEIMRKGLLKKHVRKQENQNYLKGKLLVKEQLKSNIVDRSKFFCEFEDLTFDNFENRIVLSAISSLISLIKYNERTRAELKKYQAILKDKITLTKVNTEEIYSIRFNRINEYYERIIKLSLLILEERFIKSTDKGESMGFNFIVNMNKVYQDFITEMFLEVIDEPTFKVLTVEKQHSFNSLVKERNIITRPDIIIRKNQAEYPIIIDTKYKKEDTSADYYQVIAYSLAIKTSKVCCLVYPQAESSQIEQQVLTLTRDPTQTESSVVKIYTKIIDLSLNNQVDLSYEEYVNGIKRQIRQILGNLVELSNSKKDN
jgi:5-methylcytosine-specific restriction enzyme subunit McrC